MDDIKILLAHCRKTGKKFCIEAKKNQTQWKVSNFIELTDSEAAGLKPSDFDGMLETSLALIPCYKCRSRKVSGCSCAKSHGRCGQNGKYNFQCVYCQELVIDKPTRTMPKIYVSSPHYDDIGEVLTSMKLPYSPYTGKYDCDILFINCGTSDTFDTGRLSKFVSDGGCLYLSDLTSSILTTAFPGILRFSNDTEACKIMADVVDPELFQIVGRRIEIEFDLGVWSVIEDYSGLSKCDGKVLLKASQGNAYSGKPIMVSFKFGKGTVFYTCFHNHSQASEKERMLLQLLLLKQIGSNSNQTVEQVGSLIGLNIANMKDKFRR